MSRTMGRMPTLVELENTQKALLAVVKTSIEGAIEHALSSPCVTKAQTSIQGLREQIIANITVLVSERFGGIYDYCGIPNATVHVVTFGSKPNIMAHVFVSGDGDILGGQHLVRGESSDSTTEALTSLLNMTESMLESQFADTESLKTMSQKNGASFRESSRAGGVFFRDGEGSTRVNPAAGFAAKTGQRASAKIKRSYCTPSHITIPANIGAPASGSSIDAMWDSDCVTNATFQAGGSFRGQISPADSGVDMFEQMQAANVEMYGYGTPVSTPHILSPQTSFDSDTTIADEEVTAYF